VRFRRFIRTRAGGGGRPPASRGAALLLALSALLCCAAPALAAQGDYGPVEVHKNEASLMKTVTEYEEMFLRRGYRYTSPELEEVVENIGQKLALPPTDAYIRYRFHILRDPELNAFALPDGQVYVNTGLLAALENEAQLASVLAHEVHHTAGHHTILEYRSVRGKSIAGMILGPFTFGLSDIFLVLSVYGHDREMEEEADRKGIRRMRDAGWDPREMSRTFEILAEDPEDEKPKRATAWSTHPQLLTRVEYTRSLGVEILHGEDPADLRVEGPSYRRLVRRVSLDTVLDLVAADYPRSAHALATRLVGEDATDPARHLALGDATRALGARPVETGESTATNAEKKEHVKERDTMTRSERETERLGTPEGKANLKRNMEAAQRSYTQALALEPDLAEAHRGIGLALMQLDDPEGAGRELSIYLQARPLAVDRPLMLEHLKEMTRRIRTQEPAHANTPNQ
jgi:beta-barrel assembly-enhancing protease